ncbi:LysR family transcriptional regulator [Alkalibaculum sp. M08DMB]|uniref:LysR family transcriptional regulator n=1 Tax=Alkalibaculum sporogenes TaxID=2655001 RepID=A0A6A7KA93_9FIRM|nr:LysR family transcriptional regulator [Alkalibaculum sporogenes]MPW26459.1 LysR family transcriptional regulator [Alkalibaculum sporogenes]
MEIKQLKYFLQICEDQSFTKAAKNLFITQQGLSKSIKSLENYFQAPLFYRNIHGIMLTEHGTYLKEHAHIIIKELDSIHETFKEISNSKSKNLSVGFAFGVIMAISTELITDFHSLHPHINLEIIEYPDFQCEAALLEEHIDIALTIGPVDEKKFDAVKIKTQKPHALINELNPISQKKSIDFIDLKNENIIIVNDNFKIFHSFVRKCVDLGFEPNISLTTAEIFVPYKLSRLNKGVGITVDFVSKDIYYPNVFSIPFSDSSFSWDIYIITRKDKKCQKLASTFINYIKKLIDK